MQKMFDDNITAHESVRAMSFDRPCLQTKILARVREQILRSNDERVFKTIDPVRFFFLFQDGRTWTFNTTVCRFEMINKKIKSYFMDSGRKKKDVISMQTRQTAHDSRLYAFYRMYNARYYCYYST